jgi:hypothetical protein
MADFTWCMTAIDWGFSTEDTSLKLPEVSEKARERVQLRDGGLSAYYRAERRRCG